MDIIGASLAVLEFVGRAAAKRSAREDERAANLEKQEAEKMLRAVHLEDFPPIERVVIAEPTPGLFGLIPEARRRNAEVRAQWIADQRAADEEWERLVSHNADAVIAELNRAFADNSSPSVCIDAGTDDSGTRYVTAIVVFPGPDVVLAERWNKTDTGPTRRTGRQIAHAYRSMVSSTVVATAKEAFAHAPAADEVQVAVLRREARTFAKGTKLTVIYAGSFDRDVGAIDWSTISSAKVIATVPDARIDDPVDSPLRPLKLRKQSDLQLVLAQAQRVFDQSGAHVD